MAEPKTRTNLPVLVIGGGSCGLAIGQGLKRHNIPCIIFEREEIINQRAHVRDWALACHWSAPILASLVGDDKWSRINEVFVDRALTADRLAKLTPMKILHGTTGETIAHLPVVGILYRFLRSRFRAYLAEGLDVRFGMTLNRFSCSGDTVSAHFADGTEVVGRLLIGADGVNSRVRSLLFEDEPERAQLTRLPFAATFINASFSREQALFLRSDAYNPLANAIVHPLGRVGFLATLDAPSEDRPEDWRFTVYIGWPLSGGGDREGGESGETQSNDALGEVMAPLGAKDASYWLQDGKRRAREEGWGEPLRSAYEWLGDDVKTVYYVQLSNWDPSLPEHKWNNHGGLVTLAGDAAHPMTYHRGQGLNHAIADAGKLTELLSSQTVQNLAELIDEYEAEMCARGGEEVRLSEVNTRMLHDWTQFVKSPLVTKGMKPNQ